jgi:hypothetical protein
MKSTFLGLVIFILCFLPTLVNGAAPTSAGTKATAFANDPEFMARKTKMLAEQERSLSELSAMATCLGGNLTTVQQTYCDTNRKRLIERVQGDAVHLEATKRCLIASTSPNGFMDCQKKALKAISKPWQK